MGNGGSLDRGRFCSLAKFPPDEKGQFRAVGVFNITSLRKTLKRPVQGYIDLAYAGTITIAMNDCGETPPQQPFAQLGIVLSNYEQVLFDRIAELECEQEMLSSTADDQGY